MLFVLTTLACVGTAIWYQWPYPVEHTEYEEDRHQAAAGQPVNGKRAIARREVQWVRNVFSRDGKTIRHGPWTAFNGKGAKVAEGNYRNGAREGVFRNYDDNGRLIRERHFARDELHGPSRQWNGAGKLVALMNYDRGALHGKCELRCEDGQLQMALTFARGRLRNAEPEIIDERLRELLAEGAITDKRHFDELLRPTQVAFVECPLKDAVLYLGDNHDMPIRLLLEDSAISIDAPITCKMEEPLPLMVAFRQMLEPLGLVCDYRYSVFRVTTPERAREPDRTGLDQIVPPPGTRLAAAWEAPSEMDFIETPLKDTLLYMEDMHSIRFDISALPAEYRDRVTVTTSLSRIPFKHALALLLEQQKLRASLTGETIVLEQCQP
jgi:hypothetical protein